MSLRSDTLFWFRDSQSLLLRVKTGHIILIPSLYSYALKQQKPIL